MEKRGGVEHMELAMPDMVQLLKCKGKGWLAACYFWCERKLGRWCVVWSWAKREVS